MAIAIYTDLAGRHHWAESTSKETKVRLADGDWVLFDDTPSTPPPVADPFDAEVAERVAATGSATRLALGAALVPFWAPAETVTAGKVRIAPDGKTIQRNADGTTRGSYDATEQAAWTVVGGLTATQIAADPIVRAALGSQTVGERLRRASAAARGRSSVDLGVMAAPPTITFGDASLDASLTLATDTTDPAANAAKFKAIGGIPIVAFGVYRTVWDITRPSGSGGNTAGVEDKDTAQWAVPFMCDAPKIQLRMLGSAAFMVEVDGQPVSAATLATTAGGGTKYVLLDFTSAGGAKTRKIRLELSFAGGLYSVDTAPTYSIWAPTDENDVKAVVVGDSIVAATGATFPNGGWPKVAGKLLGWADVREVAFGGTGFINNASSLNTFGSAGRVADVVAHNPDLLIIPASQNDEASTASAITAAAKATFQAYRAALPNVPIVCMGVDASSSGPNAARIAVETAVKAAFDQWADPRSWWIPVTSDPQGSWQTGTGRVGATTGTGNRDRYGYDGSHPNNAGHTYIARRTAAAFRQLVLPYVP